MAESFTKLLSSILSSTVWLEDDETRIVWITMLAMADARGYVGASIPGLAHQARVSVASVRRALEKFAAPDPDSRTKDHEGRRIEEVDGGWNLLTYAKHRAVRDPERRREQTREATRRWRERRHTDGDVSQNMSHVSHGEPMSSQAEAEEEAEAEAEAEEEVEVGTTAAPTPPYVHRSAPRMLADPLAAAHCPRVSRVLELCPPRGCRPWGPGDMTEIHRQIGAHSMNYVTAVVAFVGNEIAAGRAEPKVWSHLWRFDGQPFERWAQRYAEEGVKPAAAQELSAAELVEEDARRAGMSEAAVRELVAKVSEGAKC